MQLIPGTLYKIHKKAMLVIFPIYPNEKINGHKIESYFLYNTETIVYIETVYKAISPGEQTIINILYDKKLYTTSFHDHPSVGDASDIFEEIKL